MVNREKLLFSVIAFILGAMIIAPVVSAAGNPNPGVLPVNSTYGGKSYSEWSGEWWKWALSIPIESNPILDTTGERSAEGQSGKVWFLAGTNGLTPAERSCNVPVGKAIFFPIINSEASLIELYGTNEAELRASAKSDIDKVKSLEVTIDTKTLEDLEKYRVKSNYFEFSVPEKNYLDLFHDFNIPACTSKAVSDGYWIMLTPLSKGKHTIHFHAGVPEYNFETDVTYHITVS